MKRAETFVDALARLERLQSRGKPVRGRPATLPLRTIKTAPSAFQPRLLYGDINVDDFHVRELARALTAQGIAGTFEPITVMRIGRHPYCVDGHHRLAAYETAKRELEVPVTWFEGSVREAVDEAVRLNTRDKLPMSREAKLEAAWRMVILSRGSKAEISRATTIPSSTIGNMRKKLQELEQAAAAAADGTSFDGEGTDWPFECRLTWREAKGFGKEWTHKEHDWEEAVISDWAQRLSKTFGREWGKAPRLAAMAIFRFSERLPPRIVEAWRNEDLLSGFEWEEEA